MGHREEFSENSLLQSVSCILVGLNCYHKVPQTERWKKQPFFPYGSGGWKSKFEVQQNWFPLDLFSWLADGHVLAVSSHSLSFVCLCTREEGKIRLGTHT